MKRIGIQLQYSLDDGTQRGGDLANPLFELLRAVREGGSIKMAAQDLGLSYRHVWGQLKRWEEALGQPLVVWTQGQPAQLTPFAERLLWGETRARARLTPHIEALRIELARVVREALEGDDQVLAIHASHDLALPQLRELARELRLHVEMRFCGSVDALQALADGRCQVAGFHVPALPQGSQRFALAMKSRLKPGQHKLIACLQRTQGLIVAAGNPKGITGLADLTRPDVNFLNRQVGSGTRLLTEHLLAEARIDPASVAGWSGEPENSHVAVAAAIASGVADAAIGVAAAAHSFGLGFVPLIEEDYYLVCLKDALEQLPVARLRQTLHSPAWRRTLEGLAGYRPAAEMGDVLSLTRALSWWSFETPRTRRAAPSPSAE